LKEDLLNTSVKRVLRKKFELGLFDDPYRYSDVAGKETVMKPAFLEAARDIARKSIVLLKNSICAGTGKARVATIRSVKKLAVIGPLANEKKEMIGAWSAAGDWKNRLRY